MSLPPPNHLSPRFPDPVHRLHDRFIARRVAKEHAEADVAIAHLDAPDDFPPFLPLSWRQKRNPHRERENVLPAGGNGELDLRILLPRDERSGGRKQQIGRRRLREKSGVVGDGALHHAHDLRIISDERLDDVHGVLEEGRLLLDEEVHVGLELERDLLDDHFLLFEGFDGARIRHAACSQTSQLRLHRREVAAGRVAERDAILQTGNRLALFFENVLEKLGGLHVLAVRKRERRQTIFDFTQLLYSMDRNSR